MSDIIDIYGLSPLQEGMLFHTLLDRDDKDSSAYIIQANFLLKGKLDISAFEKAWKHIVNRHEVFRSIFLWEDVEEPLQVVCQDVPFSLSQHDWSLLSKSEREEKIKHFLKSDRERGFELDEAPLMRVTVFKETDEEYRVVWTHHHILLDGWSVSLILNEMFSIYRKIMKREAWDLPEPPPYKRYINWMGRQDKEKASQFWQEELKGITSPTQLISDKKVRDTESGYGEMSFCLSKEKTEALQAEVRKNQITLNTLVQGAWAYLLSRYSGDTDIVFGVTSSGRPTKLVDVEKMVGLFINTLPARIRIPDDMKVVDWLQELQIKEIERRQYEYVSLVDIQGWSEVPRDHSLFHSLYVFENYPVNAGTTLDEIGLEILNTEGVEQTNYPLNLVVIPSNQLTFKLMYDRSTFDQSTIQQIEGHLLQILNQMTEDEERTLSEIVYVPEEEQKQLLEEWNDTPVEYSYESTIHERFEEQVLRTPEAVAVVYEDRQLTYRELNEQANQLAHYLQKCGVGPESLVGLCVERSPEMMIGLLGILKAGGAYVPLDPTYPEQRLQYILADAGIQLVVTQESLLESSWLPEEIQAVCLDRDQVELEKESMDLPAAHVSADRLAYIIYTSGSTGNPKGVMVEHHNVI
ncbi:AMP-binding enzyme, partial [Thermoactinomyces sp. DSM 45892]